MNKYEVKDHEPSYLPDGEWKLVWADEFDGTELDTTKWSYRTNFWGREFEAYSAEGVVLDGNSHVELHRTVRDGGYVSPQFQTGENSFDVPCDRTKRPPSGNDAFWPLGELQPPKFVHRYGYYECRCKSRNTPRTCGVHFGQVGCVNQYRNACEVNKKRVAMRKHGYSFLLKTSDLSVAFITL